MSLRLLVDECLLNSLLVEALSEAGHDVQTVSQVELISKPDEVIFAHAIADNRVVITANCLDFIDLATARLAAGAHHPGILLVFQYNNPNKDMTIVEIVEAISNFEATEALITDTCISLVKYRY